MPTSPDVVVAGGLVAGDSSTADAFRLDVATGRTVRLPALPVPVHDVAGADLRGVPTVLGGGNATEQDAVQAYDGSAWAVTGHLPTARSDLSAVQLTGRTLVIGGYDGLTPALPEVLATSDGRSFRAVGRLRLGVRYAAVAVAGGAVWAFGGERNGAMVDVVQRLDPRTGACRVAVRLPRPLGHAVAIPVDGRVLLIGGRTSADHVVDRMWWFDPSDPSASFHPAGHLPSPLADSAATVVGGAAYLVGGETPGLSNRVVRLSFVGR